MARGKTSLVSLAAFVGTDPAKGLKNKGFLGSVPGGPAAVWDRMNRIDGIEGV